MTNWDNKFFLNALLIESYSKDPRKKVGCIVVNSDHQQLSGGYNGFPRRILDTPERLNDKQLKLQIVVHAEANAIAAAAKNGHSLKYGTIYITHPPCSQCAALIIQSGIDAVKYLQGKPKSGWEENWKLALKILREARIGTQCFSRKKLIFPEVFKSFTYPE